MTTVICSLPVTIIIFYDSAYPCGSTNVSLYSHEPQISQQLPHLEPKCRTALVAVVRVSTFMAP
jgi:hypothetical protein